MKGGYFLLRRWADRSVVKVEALRWDCVFDATDNASEEEFEEEDLGGRDSLFAICCFSAAIWFREETRREDVVELESVSFTDRVEEALGFIPCRGGTLPGREGGSLNADWFRLESEGTLLGVCISKDTCPVVLLVWPLSTEVGVALATLSIP